MRARTAALLAAVVGLAIPLEAQADPRTEYLAEQLKTNDDYRVRTQAALALGASDDDSAMAPLCEGLADSNISVRVAAAAALGKLGRAAATSCLKEAGDKETAPGVKSQIEKSLATLAGGGAGGLAPPPPPGADTQFYVALQVTNKTSRSADEIDTLIRASVQSKLLASPGYAVAPKQETIAQGGQIVKDKKLHGFFLIATVEAPVYDGENLTQTVRLSMWSYPAKAFQAEFSPKLTQSGTPTADPKSEVVLMKMCAEQATETFKKVAASSI